MITAKKILREFRTGSSLPVLVETECSRRFVIKWWNTAEGQIECINDWILSSLAGVCGIRVPSVELIEFPPQLTIQIMDPELKELAEKNSGVNLGSHFIENAIQYTPAFFHNVDNKIKESIFLFDLLFLNFDRTESNPNMLLSENELFCIDFSTSATLRQTAGWPSPSELSCLRLLRQHPFYISDPSIGLLIDFSTIRDLIDKAVTSIPELWISVLKCLPDELRELLKKVLTVTFRDYKHLINDRLVKLKEIPYESIEDRRKKSKKNSADFLKLHSRYQPGKRI